MIVSRRRGRARGRGGSSRVTHATSDVAAVLEMGPMIPDPFLFEACMVEPKGVVEGMAFVLPALTVPIPLSLI